MNIEVPHKEEEEKKKARACVVLAVPVVDCVEDLGSGIPVCKLFQAEVVV